MKKNIGVVPAVYPMPVLMVAAYDRNEKVNVMNVAWGQICDMDKIILFIGEGKKTWLNIQESKAFTVALADKAHVDVADFFGIASGNKINDKFELDEETTNIVKIKQEEKFNEILEEQNKIMESRRIDGHIYEYVEGSKNSVWLIDNNLNNGDVFEEIQQEVFKDAQEGDLFEYINGEYKINK